MLNSVFFSRFEYLSKFQKFNDRWSFSVEEVAKKNRQNLKKYVTKTEKNITIKHKRSKQMKKIFKSLSEERDGRSEKRGSLIFDIRQSVSRAYDSESVRFQAIHPSILLLHFSTHRNPLVVHLSWTLHKQLHLCAQVYGDRWMDRRDGWMTEATISRHHINLPRSRYIFVDDNNNNTSSTITHKEPLTDTTKDFFVSIFVKPPILLLFRKEVVNPQKRIHTWKAAS